MKAQIILADAVSLPNDGTFSLLRGGVDKVHIPPGVPFVFRGGIVVRFLATASEVGKHDFRVMCVNEDGAKVGLDAQGDINIKEPGGAIVGFNFQLQFPKLGKYTFSVSVDKHELDSYPLQVVEGAPSAKKA